MPCDSTDIRNPALRGVLWNWKPIADALPGKMGVSDLDGIIERKGRFLVFECKKPEEPMPVGQQILLRALNREPHFTVLWIIGDPHTGEVDDYGDIDPDTGEFGSLVGPDGLGPWDYARMWYEAVERGDI